MIFIGIDPGKSGGMAVINENKEILFLLPFSKEEYVETISRLYVFGKVGAAIEKVSTMPHDGRVGAFNFGKNFGYIKGILDSFGIEFIEVPPITWKKEFDLIKKDKSYSVEKAKELFPGVELLRTKRCKKEHDGMAEALLLAEYCRRK